MGQRPPALVAVTAARRVSHRAPLQRDGQAVTKESKGRPGESRRVDVDRLPLGAAVERLAAGDAFERCSPLTGAAGLVIDLDATGIGGEASSVAAACTHMRQVPCPIVVWLGRERVEHLAANARTIVACADVVVDSQDDLAAIVATIKRAPLAAMTLVQLLRTTLDVDVHAALIHESLAYSTLQSGPEFSRWLAAQSSRAAPARDTTAAVAVERAGARLDVVLDRPASHNAFSADMRDALAEALVMVAADATITRVVLRGRGPSFCSGGDLAEFGMTPDPATAHGVRSTRNIGRLLAAHAARIQAEVHGACVGAGVELPAFAGTVIANTDAFFQLPEVGMGLVPGAGGTVSLPRRIGRQRTAWLGLTRARLDATTALAWGLVDRLVT